MYRYDDFDRQFIRQRSAQFRKQVERRLNGGLSEDEFKPLRLQNGLYLQLHAYMLRVAIPYGILSADQLRQLAMIAERYDRAYGHFTTRQNIQFNWVALQQLPQLLDDLAAADLHCIQTSGNCIRNITADPFAGVAADEYADPRPYCEALRQWSSAHPEFAYLPRKFKFAVIGAQQDRAAIKLHDIGLRLHPGDDGRPGFEIWVGGGQGRTPKIAHKLFSRVPVERLLATLESMLRVYNLEGRRDNKYKARIKILVNAIGPQQYRDKVLADLRQTGAGAPRHHPAADRRHRRALHPAAGAGHCRQPVRERRRDRAAPGGPDLAGDQCLPPPAVGPPDRRGLTEAARRHTGGRHQRTNAADCRSGG